MRIGLLTDRFGAGSGGAELYLRELAAWLVSRGDEPLLFAMDEPADFPARAVRVDPGPWPRGLRERRLAKLLLDAARRERCDATLAIRPFPGADFFQPHGGAMDAAWRARGESKQGWRRPLWSLGHAFDLKFRLLRDLEARTVKEAARILPVSQESAEQIRASYPGAGSRILEIPLGVDFGRFSPREQAEPVRERLAIEPDARVVLFAAHDFELKGLRAAMDVVRALRSDGLKVCLLVMGAGRNESRWKRLAQRLEIEHAVHFLGNQTRLAAWLRAADLLLHPTFFDPCARVVLEALACGTPVVTTRRNGAFRAGDTGIEAVEDPRDISTLAKSCLRLLEAGRSEEEFGFLSAERSAPAHFQALRDALERPRAF